MQKTKLKILVLESDKTHRAVYEAKLAMEGFRVFATGDGAQGLTLIRKEKPDVVLMGLILASMNGYDVIAAVRALADVSLRKTPILVISNLNSETEMRQAMAAGADAFLLKSSTSIHDIAQAARRQARKRR